MIGRPSWREWEYVSQELQGLGLYETSWIFFIFSLMLWLLMVSLSFISSVAWETLLVVSFYHTGKMGGNIIGVAWRRCRVANVWQFEKVIDFKLSPSSLFFARWWSSFIVCISGVPCRRLSYTHRGCRLCVSSEHANTQQSWCLELDLLSNGFEKEILMSGVRRCRRNQIMNDDMGAVQLRGGLVWAGHLRCWSKREERDTFHRVETNAYYPILGSPLVFWEQKWTVNSLLQDLYYPSVPTHFIPGNDMPEAGPLVRTLILFAAGW